MSTRTRTALSGRCVVSPARRRGLSRSRLSGVTLDHEVTSGTRGVLRNREVSLRVDRRAIGGVPLVCREPLLRQPICEPPDETLRYGRLTNLAKVRAGKACPSLTVELHLLPPCSGTVTSTAYHSTARKSTDPSAGVSGQTNTT